MELVLRDLMAALGPFVDRDHWTLIWREGKEEKIDTSGQDLARADKVEIFVSQADMIALLARLRIAAVFLEAEDGRRLERGAVSGRLGGA